MANMAVIEKAYDTIYDYLMNKSPNKEGYKQLLERDAKVSDTIFLEDVSLYGTLLDLREAIREATAKSRGTQNVRKVMQDILKYSEKSGRQSFLQKAYKDDDGYTMVCDSFRFVRTKDNVDLPLLDEKRDGKWIDWKRIVPDVNDRREVKLPSVSEIKEFIKLNKKNRQYLYSNKLVYVLKNDNGEAIAAFDAKWLKGLIEAVGDKAKGYVSNKKARVNPMLIVNGDTSCLICPICLETSHYDFVWEYDAETA